MARARSIAHDVLDQLRQNEAADSANKEALEAGLKKDKDRQRVKVKGRVRAHGEVISCSQKQMREIEEAVKQAEGVQSRLTHERYARFADLKVCERRGDLRRGRPSCEAFSDATQRALERERQVLVTARDQLLTVESDAQRLLTELRVVRATISKDTGSRRLAISHDLSTLRPAPVQLGGSAPSNPEALGDAAGLGPAVNGEAVGTGHGSAVDSQQAISRSAQFVEDVYALRRRSEHLVSKIRRDSTEATRAVEQAFAKRTRELTEMKKGFQEHLVEIDHAMSRAQRALEVAQERLDPAGGDLAQQDKVQLLRGAVENLQLSRNNLAQDLRNKSAALAIDNSCRRCTPQVACEPTKQQLQQSASVPNFRATSGLAHIGQGRGGFCPAASGALELADSVDSSASTAATAADPGFGARQGAAGLGACGSSSALKVAGGLVMPPAAATPKVQPQEQH